MIIIIKTNQNIDKKIKKGKMIYDSRVEIEDLL